MSPGHVHPGFVGRSAGELLANSIKNIERTGILAEIEQCFTRIQNIGPFYVHADSATPGDCVHVVFPPSILAGNGLLDCFEVQRGDTRCAPDFWSPAPVEVLELALWDPSYHHVGLMPADHDDLV
jgi:hypothetical protein